MFPEIQRDINLETMGMKTIVDEHLARESVDRQKRGRIELEELPRKKREQEKERYPWQEKQGSMKKVTDLGSSANSKIIVIITNMCQAVSVYCIRCSSFLSTNFWIENLKKVMANDLDGG